MDLAAQENDLISRQAVLDAIEDEWHGCTGEYPASTIINDTCQRIEQLPSAQPDDRLAKIADLVDGTIDHFDLDDAMDLLYQIKEVLK